jgi:cytochrome c oxidase assembly factor CtaG
VSAWDAAIGVILAASAAIYALGLRQLWRNAGRARGVRWLNVVAFAAALGSLVIALLSPLATLSDVLFSAHMGQHEILMLVAAPLIVMGKPWLTGAWALPARVRARVLALAQAPLLRRPFRAVTGPVTILVLHGLALWIWHVPRLFEGAMHSEGVHAFQHFCFFATAALFWWALVHGRYGRGGYGAGVCSCSSPACTAACWARCSRSRAASGTRSTTRVRGKRVPIRSPIKPSRV